MTPQEIRRRRLKSDYNQMCNIRGKIISWEAVSGTAPYVEEYRLTVNVRTIIGVGNASPVYRSSSVIKVVLPPDYPYKAPKITMISDPQPFHPNWYESKNWCNGTWMISEALGDHVIRMVKTLQFDPYITNPDSPANSAAKAWYVTNERSGLFPCDKQKLPDPSTKNSGETGVHFKIK